MTTASLLSLCSLSGTGVSGHMSGILPARGTGSSVAAGACREVTGSAVSEALGPFEGYLLLTVLPWDMHLPLTDSVSSSVKWDSSPDRFVVISMTPNTGFSPS